MMSDEYWTFLSTWDDRQRGINDQSACSTVHWSAAAMDAAT